MSDEALDISGLTIRYGPTTVLSGVDLTVAPGESVALMGPSGSGKSSLLACATGMKVAEVGTVLVAGQQISAMSASARAAFRRKHLGLVFQDADLLPELSVEENVVVTLLFDGMARTTAMERAREVLAAVGLAEHSAKRTDEISGGQAQRVALARALVRPEVKLVVADEPTASLDADNAAHVIGLLLDRARANGAGALVATHDPAVAERCDSVHLLRQAPADLLS